MAGDRYIFDKPSFRGIEFEIDQQNEDGGHRQVPHLYFGTDQYEVENIGALPDVFNIPAYVTAPDLDEKVRRLRAAVKDGSPGTLHLPFYNEDVQCVVSTFRITGVKDALGRIRFNIVFTRAGDSQRGPVAVRTPLARLPYAQDVMEQSALSDFLKRFNLKFAQGFTALNVVKNWNETLDFIVKSTFANYVPGLNEAVNNIKKLNGLLLNGEHAPSLRDGLDGLALVYETERVKGGAVFESVTNMTLPLRTGNSTQAAIQNNNTEATTALANRLGLAHLASFVINTDYLDQNQAQAARSRFAEYALFEQSRSSRLGDSDSFNAATELLALVGSEFQDINDDLRPLAIDDNARQGTALSLAWEYYRDPSRDTELMTRNGVLNGAVMPPRVIYVTR